MSNVLFLNQLTSALIHYGLSACLRRLGKMGLLASWRLLVSFEAFLPFVILLRLTIAYCQPKRNRRSCKVSYNLKAFNDCGYEKLTSLGGVINKQMRDCAFHFSKYDESYYKLLASFSFPSALHEICAQKHVTHIHVELSEHIRLHTLQGWLWLFCKLAASPLIVMRNFLRSKLNRNSVKKSLRCSKTLSCSEQMFMSF